MAYLKIEKKISLTFISILHLLLSCTLSNAQSSKSLFSLLPSSHTNITFSNNVPNNESMNILVSPYHYNGGGVAVGDINNDGLSDIFFTSNFGPDKLYLNKGDLKFEDITTSAKVVGYQSWETGVTMVDINNDGWLDIYVCRSGQAPGTPSSNLLYINNKDNTFSEQAVSYGLNDRSYSTQATFFDYDLDGDLDVYITNHNIKETYTYDFELGENFRDPKVGDKIFKNEGGYFIDVTSSAGIIGKSISYGLGTMIGDINKDGWPDIYVCNDFAERDYLYYNNGDGTFSEVLTKSVYHTSNFSMGGDLEDINNDGWLDIVVVDMVAEDNYRQKTNMSSMNPEIFWENVEFGLHYQYMFNSLQINNGNGSFSEIAQLAGISNTDWSWGPLFADFDNDGNKDLFVTNGLRKDTRNKDYINWLKENYPKEIGTRAEKLNKAIDKMPSQKIRNYMFRGGNELKFENVTEHWGFNQTSFSNGAAYADFDNDGDLDLVVNNLDHEAFVYRNNSSEQNTNNYLKIKLKGPAKNTMGIGAKVEVLTSNGKLYDELYMSKGYQSSVEPHFLFGLGNSKVVDKLILTWPDGKVQEVKNIEANQSLTLSYSDASSVQEQKDPPRTLFSDVTKEVRLDHKHVENEFDDFEKEILLPYKTSQLGPAIAIGDINNDGLDDFYIGGAKGHSGSLYTQKPNGQFISNPIEVFGYDKESEDIDAVFFDLENDNDLDLYVVSGGNEFEANSPLLQDRIYINDGQGNFSKGENILPEMLQSGGCVVPGDFNNDGNTDLFVGGKMVPQKYPYPSRSYILQNIDGKFTDVTDDIAPDLISPGLVTDALWTDFNNDGNQDLIVVGEWMPVLLFQNAGNRFNNISSEADIINQTGWWFNISSGDFDNDGDEDFILGNLGLNSKYKASEENPFEIYADDFDNNGKVDIVLGYNANGKLYPVRGRECSSQQMPFIKEKFKSYHEFGIATINDIFSDVALQKSLHLKANTFASSYMENKGNGKFEIKPLPSLTQVSVVNGTVVKDFDRDNNLDILIAGNLYPFEVETTRADAGIGLLLKGDGKGNFEPVPSYESGFFVDGDVRELKSLKLAKNGFGILAGKNNSNLQLIKHLPVNLK
ncbi:VCBS repeat-containing protein [Fulvivirgaceae bacterium BMA10]|uniref:VCBS repeat-containing protein n=1 Tax=Splendidivirga corallicola TaxID=3051826 RepID=A0ABT8KJJ2_9BACT|nr:VCBS repeat-containing protein [Fulvivirgaceae bacterium BMA10]